MLSSSGSLNVQATSASLTSAELTSLVSTATDIELDAHRNLLVASAGGMIVKGTNVNPGIIGLSVTSNNDLKFSSSALLQINGNVVQLSSVDKLDFAFSSGSSKIFSTVGPTSFTTERGLAINSDSSLALLAPKGPNNIISRSNRITTDGAILFAAKDDVDIAVGALESYVGNDVTIVGGDNAKFDIDANRKATIISKAFTMNTKTFVNVLSAKNLLAFSRDQISYTATDILGKNIIFAANDVQFDAHGNLDISAKKVTLDGLNQVAYSAIENFAATSTQETQFTTKGSITFSGEEVTLATTADSLSLLNNQKSISIQLVPNHYSPGFFATGGSTGTISSKNTLAITTSGTTPGPINIDGRSGINVVAKKAVTLTTSKTVEDVDIFADGSITFSGSGVLVQSNSDVVGSFLTSSAINSDSDLTVSAISNTPSRESVHVNVASNAILQGSQLIQINSKTTLLQANDTMRIAGGSQSIKSTATTIRVESNGGMINMASDAASSSDFTIKAKSIISTSSNRTQFIANNGVVDMLGSKLIVQGGNISISSGSFKSADITIKSGGLVEFSSGNSEALRYNANTQISLFAKANIAFSTSAVQSDTFNGNINIGATLADACITNSKNNAFDIKADNFLMIDAAEDTSITSTAGRIKLSSLGVGSTTISSDGWDHDPLGPIVGFEEPLAVLVRNSATKPVSLKATKNIFIYGYEGVEYASSATLKSTTTAATIVRSESPQAITTIFAQKGKNIFTPTKETVIRAGTSSLDGDIRLNATDEVKFLSTNANSPISFVQLGASSLATEVGINLVGTNDAITLKASKFTITASGSFNSSSEANANSWATTKQLKIDSTDRKISFTGQTGASLTSTGAVALSSAGDDGELTVTSSETLSLSSIATQTAITAVESEIQSNTDLQLQSSAATNLNGQIVDLLSGGSVSIVSSAAEVVVTSAGILDLDFQDTIDIDSAAVTFSKDGTSSIMRISAGGDDAQDGIDITSTGQVEHTAATAGLLYSGNVIEFRAVDVVNLQTQGGTASSIGLTANRVAFKVENGQFNVAANNANEPVTFNGNSGISTTTDTLISFDATAAATGAIELNAAQADLKLTAPDSISLLAKTSLVVSVTDDINVATKTDDITMTVTESTATIQGHGHGKFEATTALTITSTTNGAAYTIQTAGSNSDVQFKSIGDLTAVSLKNIKLTATNLVDVDATNGITVKAKEENSFVAGEDIVAVADNLLSLFGNKAAQADVKSTAGSINMHSESKVAFIVGKELKLNTAQNIVAKGNSVLVTSRTADNAHTVKAGLTTNSNTLSVLGSAAQQLQGTVTTFTASNPRSVDASGISFDSSNSIKFTSASSIDVKSKANQLYTATQNFVVKGSTIAVQSSEDFNMKGATIAVSHAQPAIFTSNDELLLTTTDSFDITAAKNANYIASSITVSAPSNLLKHAVTGNGKVNGESITYKSNGALTMQTQAALNINSGGDINFEGSAHKITEGIFTATARRMNVNANVVQLIQVGGATPIEFTAGPDGTVAFRSTHGIMDLTATGTVTASTPKFISFIAEGAATFQGTEVTVSAGQNGADTMRFQSVDDRITFAPKASFNMDVDVAVKFNARIIRFNGDGFGAVDDIERFQLQANDLLTLRRVKVLQADGTLSFVSSKHLKVHGNKINLSSVGVTKSMVLKTLGARSDIKFLSGKQTSFNAQSINIIAKQNLGPNGGLFKFKSYNPHAIEIGSMFGSAEVAAATSMTVTSAGNIQFRGKNGIFFSLDEKIGFFGATPVNKIDFPLVLLADNCNHPPEDFDCPGYNTIMNGFANALKTIGLYDT